MEPLDFDVKKLKEEDRRFIMNRSLNIASINAANKLVNTSLMISFSSILIAIFSIIFAIQNGFRKISFYVLIIELILFVIIYFWYFLAQKKVTNQLNAAESGHNLMFLKHFEYAKKNKNKKV